MKRKRPFRLLSILVVTSMVMTLIGMAIRHSVGKNVEQLQEGPALAVPFMLMADDSLLAAAQAADGNETLSKPGDTPPVLPEESNDTSSQEGEKEPTEEPEAEQDAQQEQIVVEPPETNSLQIGTVDESYFDDALFVGDSRTLGLSQYGRLGNADYFADTGMTVFNVLTQSASDTNFSKQDLPTLLSGKQYGKIYLMLGINEIGYPFESIETQYQTVLETIRTLQPDAVIVLCANLHVTRSAAASTPRLEPDNIEKLDEMIAGMADGKTVFFLDVNPVFCDEEGYLNEDLTGDGVHPYGTGYELWAQWLMEHGIT